jgi:hypothetical protein
MFLQWQRSELQQTSVDQEDLLAWFNDWQDFWSHDMHKGAMK